ncbi:MAG: hypothetical protein JNJ50_10325 [Acidobacteria bacterium]|nr:hypothetical protein [Acidobacteriota bacterium]
MVFTGSSATRARDLTKNQTAIATASPDSTTTSVANAIRRELNPAARRGSTGKCAAATGSAASGNDSRTSFTSATNL